MTIFNSNRLGIEVFDLDKKTIHKIRNGWYSDDYFLNTINILNELSMEGYTLGSKNTDLKNTLKEQNINIGDIEIEMQIFTSRKGKSIIVGIDESLAILKVATGYFDNNGEFINTYENLEIEAIHDGDLVEYSGTKTQVKPVMKIRGRYRHFGHLETIILGLLSEPTRIATNVYNVLVAADGKPILFFPARFAHYKMQSIHGYAYSVAIDRYRFENNEGPKSFVSTKEQGSLWRGIPTGTISHSTIACFLGNSSETMMQYSNIIDITKPRIALIDFHNDCVGESLKIIDEMWNKYWNMYKNGNHNEALRYKLFGVRPDTSSDLFDESIKLKDRINENKGVSSKLIHNLRNAIDIRWKNWIINYNDKDINEMKEMAIEYLKDIKIVVTGGFNENKIRKFENENVPVDVYGVGSSLLENSSLSGTNNDFTADVVRVKINGEWYDLSKVGRKVCFNEKLIKIR